MGRDAGSRLRPSVRRSPRRRGTMQSLNHGNGGASSAPSPYACRHCFGTARVAPAVKPSEAPRLFGGQATNQPSVRPFRPPHFRDDRRDFRPDTCLPAATPTTEDAIAVAVDEQQA